MTKGALRNYAWIEDNRRRVDEMTGGRVAYVYLPDTYAGGYTNFNRYYFAQVGKEAAIIDERYNGGGDIADYIIDYLRRPLLSYWSMREGTDITTPIEAIFGPKVMITNEMAGSGGDAMPWMFRHTGIGPLVGKRTWGGLVGHYTNPGDLLDGGFTGTPEPGVLQPQRHLGRGEPRRPARRRGGIRSAGGARGSRPATREGGGGGDGLAQEEFAAAAPAPSAVS